MSELVEIGLKLAFQLDPLDIRHRTSEVLNKEVKKVLAEWFPGMNVNYKVVCDETNNPHLVQDNVQLVADIYIEPPDFVPMFDFGVIRLHTLITIVTEDKMPK
jgi:hypothetical protein